jgi:uncharacterized protein YgiM (DUF1202 family)
MQAMQAQTKRTSRHLLPLLLSASLLILLIGGLLSVSVSTVQAQDFGSGWLGQYYNNTDFTGSPAFSRVDSQINFNYGAGSPVSGFINADNFSIRWNAVQDFAEGNYRFTAVAQDGIRVTIDGQVVIDQLANNGSQQSYTADRFIAAGGRDITVDFVARTGNAAVQFFWTPISVEPTGTAGPTATPTATGLPSIPPGALAATVIRASVLNVRNAPSLGGGVIDRVLRGQTYAVIGRDPDARWFLIQMADKQGWVYGYYLYFNLNEFTAPVASAASALGLPAGVTDTGVMGQSKAGLRLRGEPNLSSEQTGRVIWGSFLPIVGRTAGNDWYQVVWKGTVGWSILALSILSMAI